jgi:pantetheine-phosphate adenylyltransferase
LRIRVALAASALTAALAAAPAQAATSAGCDGGSFTVIAPSGKTITQRGDQLKPADLRGRVEVRPFDNLLMHFAVENGASVIIRGLRAVSDFEYEFQMAANNKRIAPQIETVFLMASETSQFISSRFVKEIHGLGGDVSSFVSAEVLRRLDARHGRA